MMKKYWGKKDWSESLYINYVYEEDEDGYIMEEPMMSVFDLGMKFDWMKILGFNDHNNFEDMNSFITFSEDFEAYRNGKI